MQHAVQAPDLVWDGGGPASSIQTDCLQEVWIKVKNRNGNAATTHRGIPYKTRDSDKIPKTTFLKADGQLATAVADLRRLTAISKHNWYNLTSINVKPQRLEFSVMRKVLSPINLLSDSSCYICKMPVYSATACSSGHSCTTSGVCTRSKSIEGSSRRTHLPTILLFAAAHREGCNGD